MKDTLYIYSKNDERHPVYTYRPHLETLAKARGVPGISTLSRIFPLRLEIARFPSFEQLIMNNPLQAIPRPTISSSCTSKIIIHTIN